MWICQSGWNICLLQLRTYILFCIVLDQVQSQDQVGSPIVRMSLPSSSPHPEKKISHWLTKYTYWIIKYKYWFIVNVQILLAIRACVLDSCALIRALINISGLQWADQWSRSLTNYCYTSRASQFKLAVLHSDCRRCAASAVEKSARLS